jgi:hypothetical protein
MSQDLRALYEQMKRVQNEESVLRRQLGQVNDTKKSIRESIERFMRDSNVHVINVSGTPDTMELVEERKYESLTKDAMVHKIIEFFKTTAVQDAYRNATADDQAQALLHHVFMVRAFDVVRKLKVKTNKSAKRIQEAIESSTSAAPIVSSQNAAVTDPSQQDTKPQLKVHRISRHQRDRL